MNEPSIKQLRYFITVVETGSFRKAADKLGVSQPTLTAQIAALEKIIEATLLERSHHGTVVSPMGRSILPYAQAILSENREIMNIVKDSLKSPAGTHRLGVP